MRFPDGRALVQTVDFFPPMVNDAYGFGRIAAANALSDVYAMGGTPLAAMNILCYPCKTLPLEPMREMLSGCLDAVREAGAVPAGGHSVEDSAIKLGLAVSGSIDPACMASNRGARAGDILLLTKPLGTGLIINAIKAQVENYQALEQMLITVCGRLNKHAGACIERFAIKGATDVTGFGLGGHLLELAQASGVQMRITLADLPLMDRALELAVAGFLPGGSINNQKHYMPRCKVLGKPDPWRLALAFDAQTSGGLLLSVPELKLKDVQAMLQDNGDLAQVIGHVEAGKKASPALLFE